LVSKVNQQSIEAASGGVSLSKLAIFKVRPTICETFGEVLANGVVIELVNDPSGRE
jgi:hypothetical protein